MTLPEEMRERLSDIIYEAQSWIDDDELKRRARVVAIDNIVTLVKEVDRKARMDEHKVIQGAVAEAFNTAMEEDLDGLSIFDDWRASRYRDLKR